MMDIPRSWGTQLRSIASFKQKQRFWLYPQKNETGHPWNPNKAFAAFRKSPSNLLLYTESF